PGSATPTSPSRTPATHAGLPPSSLPASPGKVRTGPADGSPGPRGADDRIPKNAHLPAVLMRHAVDAPAFARAMQVYLEALRQHEDSINSLNVYPVPDGDTGTNLRLTQQAVVDA